MYNSKKYFKLVNPSPHHSVSPPQNLTSLCVVICSFRNISVCNSSVVYLYRSHRSPARCILFSTSRSPSESIVTFYAPQLGVKCWTLTKPLSCITQAFTGINYNPYLSSAEPQV